MNMCIELLIKVQLRMIFSCVLFDIWRLLQRKLAKCIVMLLLKQVDLCQLTVSDRFTNQYNPFENGMSMKFGY